MERKKVIHIHSNVENKQPSPSMLELGEIAVNNADGNEFLSIKSDEDKVTTFSSDEQMITWMEKKEVIPFEGQVRGEDGPESTKDSGDYGSYGITNDDLLNNKSNLVIKFNQVAPSNTSKSEVVNGGKDIYGKLVNETPDGSKEGAGIAIDMSRYAMRGGNPSFSSLTVTDKTDLSGNTTISNGDGTGTRTGHTLTINTTDVISNNTNWTETITNHTSKVITENVSATTATLSGNTLDVKEANGLTYSGGTLNSTTTGNTTIQATDGTAGDINIYAGNSLTESGKTVTINGLNSITETSPATTIVGSNTLNLSGATVNESGTTLNQNFTEINISGKTINQSGDTYNITGATNITGNTTITGNETVNGDLTVTGNTYISGDTTIGGDTTISGSTTLKNVTADTINVELLTASTIVTTNGLSKKLTWSLGTPSANTTGYNGSADATITIPSSLANLTDWNDGCLEIQGCVKASGFYQSSDRNLKENIIKPNSDKVSSANRVPILKFNYKNDESHRDVYGVVAQEVEANNLGELVYVDENGNKSVDYTSLMILKIAYLENENARLNQELFNLSKRLKNLEDKA